MKQQKSAIHEITPLSEKDCFYIADRRKSSFTYPIHSHTEEAVVGFMYACKISGDTSYKEKAAQAWRYIRRHIVDHKNGEWIWSRLGDGSVNRRDDRAGFWKCPYHNGRMCMEMIEYFDPDSF
jgi:mannose/cellobiose epimerase-like protein (N-acyl-D-glucosamine 2-epimerase family)